MSARRSILLESWRALEMLAEANPGARFVVTGSGGVLTLGDADYVAIRPTVAGVRP